MISASSLDSLEINKTHIYNDDAENAQQINMSTVPTGANWQHLPEYFLLVTLQSTS